jgi:hypothetical protein
MRLARKMGWERLEMAALAAALPLDWDQAFQLLCLHDRSVNQGREKPHRRRRRGESDETHRERLRAMWRAEKDLEAEARAVRRAERFEASGSWRHEDEPPPPELPPLETVTGWSRASGKAKRHGGLALFGGWRIGEMEKKLAKG